MKSSVMFKVAVDCLEVPERFLRVAGNAQAKFMDFQDLSNICRLVVNVTRNNVDACADCTSELGASYGRWLRHAGVGELWMQSRCGRVPRQTGLMSAP